MTTIRIYARHCQFALALLLGVALNFGVACAADTVTYYHTDALGTPVMESNAAGAITYSREYKPNGEQGLGTAKNGPGFTGHIEDIDTGLKYMQARYQDPIAGRFLSVDPVAVDLEAGNKFNRYAYALNNPYKFVDPDGGDEFLFVWKPGVDAVGHAAIGVQNRDAKGKPDGTLTVRHLWPGGDGVGKSRQAPADYRMEVVNEKNLAQFQGGEGKGADGIVRVAGDAKQDAAVLQALAKADNNPIYSAKQPMNTCSTFAAAGVQAAGIKITQTGTVTANVGPMTLTEPRVVTPIAVYNSVVESKDPRVTVVKGLPVADRNPDLEIR